MEEYAAPAPCNAGACVVINLDDEIVKMIVAPKPVSGDVFAQMYRLVIAAVGWVFAPGVGSGNAAHR